MVMLHDRAEISGKARITPEGYFVADALVAQAGNVQSYYARELALTDRDPNSIVNVFRPESEVFAVDSLRSASRLPITLDHPAQMVDAANWREYAKGETGEELLRDGQFLRVPIRVTDAGAVASVQTDRQEFSLGYSADIKFEAGVHDGQAYDAVATNLRYNHLAACRSARGGPQLRIVDERTTPQGETTMPNLVIVDGIPVDAANPAVAEPAIRNLVAARDTALQGLDTATSTVTARDATIAERDVEIANLKDQLAKATPTPQALLDAGRAYATVLDQAKRLGATVIDTMDLDAIRLAAVKHRLGDAKAASYTPEQVVVAFDMAAASLADAPVNDALASVIGSQPVSVGDAVVTATKAHDHRMARFANAHTGAAPVAANAA